MKTNNITKVKNFMKRKPWITVVAAVLVTVLACGVIASFTDYDMNMFSKDLNEDNILFESYRNFDKKTDSSGITYKNDDGVITISAGLFDGKLKEDTSFTFAEVTLKPGTYTYTCFGDKANVNQYYSYIKYGTNVVIGDFDEANITISGMTVTDGRTFTLTENTTVEFVIVLKEDTKPLNIKAYPVLVEGDDVGSFYAEGK